VRKGEQNREIEGEKRSFFGSRGRLIPGKEKGKATRGGPLFAGGVFLQEVKDEGKKEREPFSRQREKGKKEGKKRPVGKKGF